MLLFGSLSSFISLTAITAIFLYTSAKQFENLNKNNIIKANTELQKEIMSIELGIIDTINNILRNNAIMNNLDIISQTKIIKGKEEISEKYKIKLAEELSIISGYNENFIAFYNANGNINSFTIRNSVSSTTTIGYMTSFNNSNMLKIKDNDYDIYSESSNILPDRFITIKHDYNKEYDVNYYVSKEGINIEVSKAIYIPDGLDNIKKIGYIKLQKLIGKDFLNEFTAKEKIYTGFIIDKHYIVGDMGGYLDKAIEEKIKRVHTSNQISWLTTKDIFIGVIHINIIKDRHIDYIYCAPKEYFNSQLANFRITFIFFILIIGTIIFPLAYAYLKRYILSPLKNITKMIESFKKGEEVIVSKINSKDELGILYNAFDDMINTIKLREAELIISLKNAEEYNKAIISSAIVSKGDLKGNITYVNEQLCEITGYSEKELIGRPHNIFRHESVPKETFKEMWDTIQSKKIWKGLLKNKMKNGNSYYTKVTIVPILDNQNNIVEYVSLRDDVTELINSRENLKVIFHTDTLTGLGNRFRLMEDMTKKENPALAMIDLDSFREINDFYGHSIGDDIIMQVGDILFQYFIGTTVKCYRVSGDEFALLACLNDITKENFILQLKTILNKISSYQFLAGINNININASAGVAFGQEELMTKVDVALKTSKKMKKNLTIFEQNLNATEEYKTNLLWTSKIRKAIEENRVTAYFQPILNNETNKIEIYESLLRIIDEDGTPISPFHFLAISKRAKLYSSLTKIVLDKTIEKIKDSDCRFSVNLSVEDIVDIETKDYILMKIEELSKKDMLTFELVESEGIESFNDVESFIDEIKSKGCKLAIDDFGTGYSNFEYLLKLKANYIKIDGSLIKNIDKDPSRAAVVETIVSFAKKNGLKIVAEFVSDENIYNKIIQLGIDYSQGYFIGVPEQNPRG